MDVRFRNVPGSWIGVLLPSDTVLTIPLLIAEEINVSGVAMVFFKGGPGTHNVF